MPLADAVRWNERYRGPLAAEVPAPRDWLLEQQAWLPPAGGLALDAAMGQGGSAGWLLARGWRVLGIDIASAAAQQARARYPGLMAVVADLAEFTLPANTFDLILNFYYLERGLWPAYQRALRPGGLLYFETFLLPPDGQPAAINPAYVLQPGELRAAFPALRVLAYHEGAPVSCATPAHPHAPSRTVASLVAQRPPASVTL